MFRLGRATEREGIALPAGAESTLVDHWHELPIFEDVGPALGARENGWSLRSSPTATTTWLP